jgi:hypothetical protein
LHPASGQGRSDRVPRRDQRRPKATAAASGSVVPPGRASGGRSSIVPAATTPLTFNGLEGVANLTVGENRRASSGCIAYRVCQRLGLISTPSPWRSLTATRLSPSALLRARPSRGGGPNSTARATCPAQNRSWRSVIRRVCPTVGKRERSSPGRSATLPGGSPMERTSAFWTSTTPTKFRRWSH